MRVNVYHALQNKQVPRVLAEGLHYGKQGEHSREVFAARANKFLDGQRTKDITSKKLSRRKCLFAFLELNGDIIDVKSGKPVSSQDWYPGNDKTKLRLSVDAGAGYVSDLELYDHIAGLLANDAAMPGLVALAYTYWHSVLPLGVVIEHYAPTDRGIVAKPTAPISLPRGFSRVEVMLVGDVPPQAILSF